MRKPQLTVRNGLIPNQDFKGPLLKKATSYQRLRDSESALIDRDIDNHLFLSNVEARLTKVLADLQRQNPKAAKRKVSKLLSEISERLTPSEEVPF